MPTPTRVALALGSGGARGYAHIGVLAELEQRGFEVVTVAGSSIGALVGGLHCAGRLDEFVDWITGLTQLDVMRLMDVSLSKKGGVIGAERILTRVREILGDVAIEELPIPFTAVATDLGAGRAVWYQRGSLVDAIRASIAIPGVISPHSYQGRLLADGGILDPLPVAPTSAVASDVTVGVILGSDSGPEIGATRERRSPGVLRRNVAPLLGREVPADDATRSDRTKIGRFEVMGRAIDIMQDALTRYQVAGYQPDVVIRVPRRSARTLDFHRASELIALGRSLTAEALDRLPENAAADIAAPERSGPGKSGAAQLDRDGSDRHARSASDLEDPAAER